MLLDNSRYLSMLMKRLFGVLLIIIIINSTLSLFFAWNWYRASSLDNVYIISSDHTMAARKTDGSLARSEIEIKAFIRNFLEKAFAHNEYNYDVNIKEAISLMDKASKRLFLSRMDKQVRTLYKEQNAISTMHIDSLKVSEKKRPYDVLVYYNIKLQFSKAGDNVYENTNTPGGLYLKINPVLRSEKNPFGMQIRGLKFLENKEK